MTQPAARGRAIEKHFFQRRAVVARQNGGRTVIVFDTPALHDDNPVAQPLDLKHVVRRQQDRRSTLLAVGFKMAPDPVCGVRIERRGRLVQQQKFRLVDQGLRQRHACLLACGKLSARAIEKFAEIEIGGERKDPVLQMRHAVKPAEYGEILPHGEAARHIDVRTLEIHPAENLGALLGHGATEHADAARGRRHQPHDHRNGRGLAGAVAAEQPRHRTARNREGDVIDGAGGLIDLYQPLKLDRRVGQCRTGMRRGTGRRELHGHIMRSLSQQGAIRKSRIRRAGL